MEYLHACFLQSPGCEPGQGPFFSWAWSFHAWRGGTAWQPVGVGAEVKLRKFSSWYEPHALRSLWRKAPSIPEWMAVTPFWLMRASLCSEAMFMSSVVTQRGRGAIPSFPVWLWQCSLRTYISHIPSHLCQQSSKVTMLAQLTSCSNHLEKRALDLIAEEKKIQWFCLHAKQN